MNLVAVLVVLAVVGVVAAVVVGAVHGGLEEPASTLPPSGLPEGDVVPEDLAAVRFSLGFRGYRMDEVDDVLDRAQAELARRDAELARRDAQLAELRSRLSDREPQAEPAEHSTNGTHGQVRDGVGHQDNGPGNSADSGVDSGAANGTAHGAAQPATGSNGVPSPAASPQRT